MPPGMPPIIPPIMAFISAMRRICDPAVMWMTKVFLLDRSFTVSSLAAALTAVMVAALVRKVPKTTSLAVTRVPSSLLVPRART